jgi:ribosomal protein L35
MKDIHFHVKYHKWKQISRIFNKHIQQIISWPIKNIMKNYFFKDVMKALSNAQQKWNHSLQENMSNAWRATSQKQTLRDTVWPTLQSMISNFIRLMWYPIHKHTPTTNSCSDKRFSPTSCGDVEIQVHDRQHKVHNHSSMNTPHINPKLQRAILSNTNMEISV